MSHNNFTPEQQKELTDILKEANFSSNVNSVDELYIKLNRIPLICQLQAQTSKDITEIKTDLFRAIEDLKVTVIKKDDDKETRIRVLENSMWKFVGVGIVIAPIMATIATILITKILNK